MSDICLSAPDQATMYAAFAAVGIADGESVRTQGRFDDGTEWSMVDWGARNWTDENGDPQTDGLYWVVLRWNGDAPTPPLPSGVTIAWSSDDPNAGEYPVGLVRIA